MAASTFRFIDPEILPVTMREMYERILRREEVDVAAQGSQLSMFEEPRMRSLLSRQSPKS